MSNRRALIIGLTLALLVVGGLGFLSVAGARLLLHENYPQGTPQEVLTSARAMVLKGDANRLPDLIYADDDNMRAFLNELGQVLGSLQALALAVAETYPEEIAALRTEADSAAKSGHASSFIQRLAGQAGMSRRARRAQDPQESRKLFDNAAKELFADPYGWIERSEGRLSVQTITDDTAAILWDNKPVFGVGLTMRADGDKWYIALPTTAPGISRVIPKTDEAWEVMGSLMDVFDNTIKDLTKDVRAGRAAKLDDLARTAGEKAFIPAAIVVLAYGKVLDAEREAQKKAQAGAAPAPSR
jgi:hypothetical protein